MTSECSVTCGACKHNAPIMQFCRNARGDELPDDEYRCPECGYHIRRVMGRDEINWPVVKIQVIAPGAKAARL